MALEVDSEPNIIKLADKLEILVNNDRRLRRKAVDDINEIWKTISVGENSDLLIKRFVEMSMTPMITCLQNDPQEYCREKSAEIIFEFIKCASNYKEMASYFVPVATQRLSTTTEGALGVSFVEKSEEIRLLLIKTLNSLTNGMNEEMDIALFDDIVSALARTLLDPYPELKKESCEFVRSLASKSSVRGRFHQQFQSLIDPLLRNLIHQHSKVRLAAVFAIGGVVHCTSSESLKDVYPHIAQRLFDQVPQVRKAVTVIVGNWMVSLPDRHSSYGRLVPLLLSCLSDEVSEISELADKLWMEAGEIYLEENKNNLQDRIGYETKGFNGRLKNEKRRSLGCRALVAINLPYILPAVFNDIRDWKEEARIKAAQLLRQLLFHSEERMVSQLQKIIDSLVVGCKDDEPRVVKKVVESAEIVGHFVKAEVWWNLIEDKLNGTRSAPFASLMILSALIRGSNTESLRPRLKQITSYLSQSNVCHVFEVEHQMQVLSCVVSILDVAGDECRSAAYDLFFILLSLLALSGEENAKVNDAIDRLCHVTPTDSLDSLCVLYANEIFSALAFGNKEFWTSQSAEWLIFNLFVCKLGVNIVDYLDKLLPFFGVALAPEKDYEMRFRCLQTLSCVAVTAKSISTNSSKLDDFFITIIKDRILSCLLWRGGRSESTTRAATLTSLWTIFNYCSISSEKFFEIFNDLIVKLDNLMEDDNKTTRLLVCRILNLLFRNYITTFGGDHYLKFSSHLLKRVDDSDEDVRVTAVECLGRCLSSWLTSGQYIDELHCRHLEFICKGLVIFLDDSDSNLRASTLRILKDFAEHDTRHLKVALDQVKPVHQSHGVYDELIQHIGGITLR